MNTTAVYIATDTDAALVGLVCGAIALLTAGVLAYSVLEYKTGGKSSVEISEAVQYVLLPLAPSSAAMLGPIARLGMLGLFLAGNRRAGGVGKAVAGHEGLTRVAAGGGAPAPPRAWGPAPYGGQRAKPYSHPPREGFVAQ